MRTSAPSLLALLLLVAPAAAQDIRGLENCSAEKAMERRTGCLQTNVEFLQQALAKQARETNEKVNAAHRDIAALKAALVKIESELAQLKKHEPKK